MRTSMIGMTLVLMILAGCNLVEVRMSGQKTFGDDVAFLKEHTDALVLSDPQGKAQLRIKLRYGAEGQLLIDGIRRVSCPSCRVYVRAAAIPKVRNGLGISVLSTNKGVMSDRSAREQHVGGEILCEVW